MNLATEFKKTVNNPLKKFFILQAVIAGLCIFIPIFLRCADSKKYDPVEINEKGFALLKTGDSIEKFVDTIAGGRFKSKVIITYAKICGSDTFFEAEQLNSYPFGFRYSISDYVYGSTGTLFGFLYCMAAMMFIFNWAVIVNAKTKSGDNILINTLNTKGHGYNLIIGVLLILITLNPQRIHPDLHNIFSVLFFIVNIAVIVFFPIIIQTKKSLRTRITVAVVLILAIVALLFTQKITILYAEWFSLIIIAGNLIYGSLVLLKKGE